MKHELPFTQEELLTVLEAANIALGDPDIFMQCAIDMDVSDEHLDAVERKLSHYLEYRGESEVPR